MKDWQCPTCGGPGEAIYEEVDIGVGVQRFCIGFECAGCQQRVATCHECGTPLDGREHAVWCGELRGPARVTVPLEPGQTLGNAIVKRCAPDLLRELFPEDEDA